MINRVLAVLFSFIAGGEVNDNGQAYQALWWVARLTSILCIGMFLVIMALSAVIIALFPLKEVKPMLLSAQDRTNQIVKIEPLEKEAKGWDLVVHNLVRQYVKDRETIDCHTEPYRWQRLALFTSIELEQLFRQQMDPENKHSPLKQFSERGIKRSVNIIRSTSLAPRAPDIWEVEWASVDLDSKEGTQSKAQWVSTLTLEFQEREVKLEDQFINPIGLSVTHYSVDNKQFRGEGE